MSASLFACLRPSQARRLSLWRRTTTVLLLLVGFGLVSTAADAAVTSGRSTVTAGTSQIWTFKNSGGQLYARGFVGGGWGGWINLGGSIKGTPQAVSWGTDHTDVYVRWGDDAVYHRWWNGSSWADWERVGLYQVSSDISPISWGYGRIDLFARGLDGALVHDWYDSSAGGWAGAWEHMGGYISGTPSAVSWYAGHLDIYARGGNDDKLYHRWFATNSGWSAWEKIGDWQMGSDPSAGSAGTGHVQIVARGYDGAMIATWFNGSAWQSWYSLGGGIVGKPSIISWGVNHMDVYARGTDNALWHRWNNGSTWAAWESLGGGTSGEPVAVTFGSPHIDVFIDGTDGQPWHRWYNGSGWQAWEALGYPTGGYYSSSVAYGGTDGSVNTSGEADKFINAFRGASSDGSASSLYNALSPADRGYVDVRQAATVLDGGLYRAPNVAAVWEYENGDKAWLTSPDAANQYGFDLSLVLRMTQGALDRLATSPDNIVYDAPTADDLGGTDATDDGLAENAQAAGVNSGNSYTCTKNTTLRNAGGKYAIGWCVAGARAEISGWNSFVNTTRNKYYKAFISGNANKCGFLQNARTGSKGNLKYASSDIARNCGKRGISTNKFASTFYLAGGEDTNGDGKADEDNQDEFLKAGTCSRYRNVNLVTGGQSGHDKIDTLTAANSTSIKVQVRYRTKGNDFVMARYPASSAVNAGTPVDTAADWAFIPTSCLSKFPSKTKSASSAVGGM